MAHYKKGLHECKIRLVYIERSSRKNTPFVAFRFTPSGGEYERTVKLHLTTKTVDRTIAILRGMGWTGSRFSDLEHDSFSGKVVELNCFHEPFEGNDYDKWEFPPPQSVIDPVTDPAVAKKLDALFGSELKKTATKAETVPAEVDEGGDDIPF